MKITIDLLIFLNKLQATPFHKSEELVDAAKVFTNNWIEHSIEWQLNIEEILAPFEIEYSSEITPTELRALMLAILLSELGVTAKDIGDYLSEKDRLLKE